MPRIGVLAGLALRPIRNRPGGSRAGAFALPGDVVTAEHTELGTQPVELAALRARHLHGRT
jgi:hypothetical protein